MSILSCLANAHAPLAGCVCVSGWFAAPNHFLPDGPFVELTDGLSSPEAAALVPRIGANVPVLMTHGVDDDKVPIKLAKQSFKHLRQTMFKWRDIQQQLQHEDEADVEEEGASVPRPILDLTLKVYPDLKHSLGQMGLKDVYTFIAQKLPPLLPSARKQTTKSTPTRPWKDEL